MANVINYATQFLPYILEMYSAEAKSIALTQSNPNVKWIGAKTLKVPTLETSGYKDHSRTSLGFNTGAVKNDYITLECKHDRDIQFPVDPMDVDETDFATSLANVHRDFEKRNAIPEFDSYNFSKLYTDFIDLGGVVDTTTLTTANVLDWFDTQMEAMDDAGVPPEGRKLYVTPAINKVLKQAEGITRTFGVQNANGSINRKVYDLDDVEIIKVPSDRFKTAYDFSDGCVADDDALQINAILVHPDSIVARTKYSYIQMFAPGSSAFAADSYLYQNRKYGDLFVLSNRLAGVAINAEAGAGSN